jgi:NAD(P)-dependent dehydrogenase (short-subunit alcohol dehydrogenase family)
MTFCTYPESRLLFMRPWQRAVAAATVGYWNELSTCNNLITSSMAGVSGGPGLSPYVASKHAVIGMMRSAAQECAPLGIRVNTVNPGFTETRMVHSLEEQRPLSTPEEARMSFIERIALRRYASPNEIAHLMLFLASDESSYCTGGVYMIDGGVTKIN